MQATQRLLVHSEIQNSQHVLMVIYMSEPLKASYSMNCTSGEKPCRPGSVWEQHKGVLCAKKGIGLDGKSPKRTIWQHKLPI